jgi:hypothetical protein
MLWLWFGDAPQNPEHFESDEIHIITSAYQAPNPRLRATTSTFSRVDSPAMNARTNGIAREM